MRLALIAAALVLAGCSLVLPRLVPPPCDSDGDCEQFNLRFPERVDDCNRFQCNEAVSHCELGPLDRDGDGHQPIPECGGDDCDDRRADVFGGNAETCDGIDNDCDDIIDDATPLERDVGVAVSSVGSIASLAWSPDDAGAMALASAGATAASLHDLTGGMGVTRGISLVAMPDPTDLTSPTLGGTNGMGCPAPSDGRASPSCTLSQVAVASGEPMGWAAFVDRAGCDAGRLRVGLLDAGTATLELMGPDLRSNTWRGVDLAGACTRTAAGTGASAPAIVSASSAVGATPATAVLAWVRDAATRSCPAAPAEVAALGLWRATGMFGGTTNDWVVATGGGAPSVIGMTSGAAPPALAATGTGEVIAAFGDAAGGVRVVVLDALPSVPAAPDPATTPPLVAAESVVVGSGAADEVALVLSPAPGGGTRLGVVWTAGCGGGALRFAPVLWQRSARTLTAGSVVDIGRATARRPTLAFVSHGFVRATRVVGGMPVGTDDGGWLIAWRDETMTPAAVVAARVLAADASLIDTVALPFARDLASDPRVPFLYPGAATDADFSARIGFYAADASTLVGGSLLCPPPPL